MGYLLLQREENKMKEKKEELQRWVSFLSLLNSHPERDKKAQKAFMDMLEPKIDMDKSDNPVPKYETDFDLLKRIKAQQEAERRAFDGNSKGASGPDNGAS